jgi:hypothetical protein
MPAKFEIGTDVRFTDHEMKVLTGKAQKHRHLKQHIEYTPNPQDLVLIKRNAFHKIKRAKYNSSRKRILYRINAHGRLGQVDFDSTQLTTEPLPRVGSPRQKRPYRHIKHRK